MRSAKAESVIAGLPPEYSDATMSRVFRMTPGRFAAELVFRYAWIWILALSLGAVAGIALSIMVDLRWLVITLLIVCIVMPMVLAFLYYYYGLKRGCYVNTVPHRIVMTDEGLAARLVIPLRDEDIAENDEEQGEARYRTRDELFPYSSLRPFTIGSNSAIIPLSGKGAGFLWIPADAFADPENLAALLKRLDGYSGEKDS